MTIINVDVRIGGGQPPSSGGRGKSYVLYAPRTVVNTSAGKTIVPVPDRVELDPANGTATVTLDALPAETPYVFQFEVDNGYWKSSEIVALVPASGTHKLADLVVLGDDFTPPAWYSQVLDAEQFVRTVADGVPALVADAVDEDIAGRDVVEAKRYFPAEAAGGMIGENGRATDLLIDASGDVVQDSINRWAPRVAAAGGFVTGARDSAWYAGGLAGENGYATDILFNEDGTLHEDSLRLWAPRLVPLLAAAGMADGLTATVLQQVYAGKDVHQIGDSLTASGEMAAELRLLEPTINVRQSGVGGENVPAIMARAGAWPYLMSPVGMVLPESGSVDVTFKTSYAGTTSSGWPLLQGTGVREGDTYLWGTILGTRWRLSMRQKDPAVAYPSHGANDIYQLTRDGSGAPITLARPEPFIPEYGMARAGDITIAYMGQNGPDDATTEAAFNALEQHLKQRAGDRFLVMSKPAVADTGWTTHELNLLKRWGRRYCNVRRFLIDEAMDLMGLTKTSEDLANIAAGRVPRSLRRTNADGSEDTVHQTAAADRATMRYLLHPRMKELRYL